MMKLLPSTRRFFTTSAFFTLISLCYYTVTAQSFVGSKVVNASNGMTISVTTYPVGDSVEVTMTAPSNVWFGFGFGKSSMANTYCVITDGSGNISERKLGNHTAGSVLSSSLTKSSYTSSGGVGTTKVTRTLMGLNSDYFTFPGNASTITLIWAYGSSSFFSSHANRGATTLVLSKNCKNAVDVSVNQNGTQLIANKAGATYRWLDCTNGNTVINGETSQSFTPNTTGSYAAEITDAGCTDTSACFFINTIGMDEIDFTDKIKAYPSPTTGSVVLYLGDQYQNITATVYAPTGKIVSQKQYNDLDEINLSLEGGCGLYFVHIATATGQTATIKVVKI